MLIGPWGSTQIVDRTSNAGKELYESVVLSDEAKAFVIARELMYVTTYDQCVDIGLRCLCGVLTFATGTWFNSSMRVRREWQRLKLGYRVNAFLSIGAAWLLIYVGTKDAVCCWRDNRVDRKLARLTRSIRHRPRHTPESVLRGNKALRMLLGPSAGPRLYTMFGNETAKIRYPHVQLTARRDNLVKYLKEYENPVDADSEQLTDESDKNVE